MDEGMLDVVPVEVDTVPGGTASHPRIGMNRPLNIQIKDVFSGEHDAGEMLLSTAVKSAASFDAQPLALQAIHKLEPQPMHLPFRASRPGSPIVYYTPAALDRTLTLDVRMDFDRFDRDRYERYVDVISKAAQLPVFVGASALAGLGGGAGAAAAIYAAASGIKVILRAIDRWRDGSNAADLFATFDINLATPGEAPTPPGYHLFWNDGTRFQVSADDSWSASTVVAGTEGEEFKVDKEGRLRYRETDLRVDNVPYQYVLLYISGSEDDKLTDFQPTAAAAAVLSKFVQSDGTIVEDIAELAEAYNDFVFVRRVTAIDKKLAKATGTKKSELQKERDATVKHIQTSEVKDLLESDE
jgi:hypothetical protein